MFKKKWWDNNRLMLVGMYLAASADIAVAIGVWVFIFMDRN